VRVDVGDVDALWSAPETAVCVALHRLVQGVRHVKLERRVIEGVAASASMVGFVKNEPALYGNPGQASRHRRSLRARTVDRLVEEGRRVALRLKPQGFSRVADVLQHES
jgi:hypothetical protein